MREIYCSGIIDEQFWDYCSLDLLLLFPARWSTGNQPKMLLSLEKSELKTYRWDCQLYH